MWYYFFHDRRSPSAHSVEKPHRPSHLPRLRLYVRKRHTPLLKSSRGLWAHFLRSFERFNGFTAKSEHPSEAPRRQLSGLHQRAHGRLTQAKLTGDIASG